MSLSASRDNSLELIPEDFIRARTLLETAEANMPRAFKGVGQARFADATENVIEMLTTHKRIMRSDLLMAFFPDIDAQMLSAIEATLLKMKVMITVLHTEISDVEYVYTPRNN